MSRLRDDLRRLADDFEAAAIPEEAVVAGLHGGVQRERTLIPALALVGAVAALLLGALILRGVLTTPNVAAPVMPETVGIFRTVEPDATGQCVAVRLYDTTADDGRAALWAWTGTDGCAARTSNLAAGAGSAEAMALPSAAGEAPRAGIRVTAAGGVADPLDGLELILDPLAASAEGSIPGYRSADDVHGDHTLALTGVDELLVPYRVE